MPFWMVSADAWTTIKNILKPFRCIPIIDSAGVFTIVRDDSRTLVSQLFTQRSIKQGTFSVPTKSRAR